MGISAAPLVAVAGTAGLWLLYLAVVSPPNSARLRRVATVCAVSAPLLVAVVAYLVSQGRLTSLGAWIVLGVYASDLTAAAAIRWVFRATRS